MNFCCSGEFLFPCSLPPMKAEPISSTCPNRLVHPKPLKLKKRSTFAVECPLAAMAARLSSSLLFAICFCQLLQPAKDTDFHMKSLFSAFSSFCFDAKQSLFSKKVATSSSSSCCSNTAIPRSANHAENSNAEHHNSLTSQSLEASATSAMTCWIYPVLVFWFRFNMC